MANRQAGKLSKGKYRLLRSLHFTVEGMVYRIIWTSGRKRTESYGFTRQFRVKKLNKTKHCLTLIA